MENGKLEPQLILALGVTENERMSSEELNVGYDAAEKVWTLIIRYNGNGDNIREIAEDFSELSGGYGIVRIEQTMIDALSELENVIYIEKPKKLYYEIQDGISASCVFYVQNEPLNLFGEGVVVAVVDSGIDYLHPAFIDEYGKTRIIGIWDQTLSSEGENTGQPPVGYNHGVWFTSEQIDRAIEAAGTAGRQAAYNIVPSRDVSGHGTHVAGICCGNFAMDKRNNIGMATKSKILVVKLGNPSGDGFPRTTELMEGMDFVVKKGIELNMPLVVNVSIGNAYGSHDGTSLLETFMDLAADLGRTSVVVGSGNEGAEGGHVSGRFSGNITNEVRRTELIVGEYERSVNVQIWKSYEDIMSIEVISPSGMTTGMVRENPGIYRFNLDDMGLVIFFGEPSPYSRYQEIYLDFITENSFLPEGIWEIRLQGNNIVYGRYDMWLPVSNALGGNTEFIRPEPNITLTIPSTAAKVITVGAYNAFTDSYADFSGRGYTRFTNQIKPDIVAPGVNVSSASPGGGMDTRSGTSMATAFGSGAAALLMEWGIVRGNDSFLYGEKLKAYLIRGAQPVGTGRIDIFPRPNPLTGWGKLCVRASLPV